MLPERLWATMGRACRRCIPSRRERKGGILSEARTTKSAVGELFRGAIVIDALDTSNWREGSVLRNLRDGGVTAINATAAIWEDFAAAMDNLAEWSVRFEEYAEYIRPVRTVADIHAAKREGRTGVILGWQNATPVENDIRRFRLFQALGVRVVQLTYNERNLFGNGCWERTDDGLSRIGLAAVSELNRLGMLIDLSHCGDRTTLETIEHSEQPCAITHAAARSQFEATDFIRPRLKPDQAIRKLAARGGVFGVTSLPSFFPDAWQSSLGDFIDAIDYVVELVGIDHVGIGNDFCMAQPLEWWQWIIASHGKRTDRPLVEGLPIPYRHLSGLNGPLEYVNVAETLLSRGYSDEDARKILGENFLRLCGEVWRQDARAASGPGQAEAERQA